MEKMILEMETQQLMNHLTSVYKDYEAGKEYLYIPSDSRLMLVAHVDTVTRMDKLEITRVRNVFTANGVLGADDRAGVWSILQITEHCRKEGLQIPNILFTDGEEWGGTGMNEFIKKRGKRCFSNIDLVIALDRQGTNEYVTYNDLPREVAQYMESFGFMRHTGTFNDIVFFTDKYRIPSVNVSVGYYGAHSRNERWHIDEAILTINRILQIIKEPINRRYKTAKKQKRMKLYPGYKNGVYDGSYLESVDYEDHDAYMCEYCEREVANRIYHGYIICDTCWECELACEICGEEMAERTDERSGLRVCGKCINYELMNYRSVYEAL